MYNKETHHPIPIPPPPPYWAPSLTRSVVSVHLVCCIHIQGVTKNEANICFLYNKVHPCMTGRGGSISLYYVDMYGYINDTRLDQFIPARRRSAEGIVRKSLLLLIVFLLKNKIILISERSENVKIVAKYVIKCTIFNIHHDFWTLLNGISVTKYNHVNWVKIP